MEPLIQKKGKQMIELIIELLDDVVEKIKDLFFSALLFIPTLMGIITMPLWIIPYAIYKAKERHRTR